MNPSLLSRILQIWIDLQRDLLPLLRREAYLALTPVLEGLIRVLELIGMERFKQVPNASGFSRDFAEFTALDLPAQSHEALIRAQLGDQIIGHIARDSTEIEEGEKPASRRLRSHPPSRYRCQRRRAGVRARGRSGPRSRPPSSGR